MLWALLSWCGAGPAFAASAGQITVVPALGEPVAVAPGSDGNLWYADQSCLSGSLCGITRLTLSGRETEFPRNPPDGTGPIIEAVAPGPDGQVWFTDWGCTVGNGTCAIGRVTVSGKVTEFGRGLAGGLPPDQIAPGSDGAVWFIDSTNPGSGCCSPPGSIGRITPSGRISKYTRPGLDPVSITPGPDGDEWFADAGKTAIGKITPSGKITEYPLMAGEGACGIANGPDGNLWFTQPATVSATGTEETPPMIGKITPAGQITEYSSGLNQSAQPCDIATGADGNVWFADDGFATAAIGRVSPSGQITEYSSGLEGGGNAPDGTPLPPQPQSIVPGPDGNMWFAVGPCGDHLDSDCLLERIATGAPAPKRLQLRIAHAGLATGDRLTLSGSYTATRPGLVRLTLERIAGERIQVVLRVTRFGWPGVTGFDIAAAGGRFRTGHYQLVAAASDSRQTATATFRMARSETAQPQTAVPTTATLGSH